MEPKIIHQDAVVVPMKQSDRGAEAFVWSVWLIMLLIALVILIKSGRIFPLSEDWFLVPPLTGNEPDLAKWLWTHVSEHLIPFPRLILLTLLKATHGDFRVGMLFNIIMLGALAFAMICVARKVRGGRTSFVDAFFPIALLHLGNSENLFWSWQLTLLVPTALTCVILLILVSNQSLATPSAAVVGGISLMLLPVSGPHALLFAPSLSLWFGYCGFIHWRTVIREERRWTGGFLIGSAVVALCLTGLYLVNYTRPSWFPPDPTYTQALETAVKFLALGLGPAARSAWTLSVGAVIGFLVASSILAAQGVLRSRGQERYRALGILIFFGNVAVLALATGWGRATAIESVFDGQYPLRYVLTAVPALFVAFFVWELYGSTRLRTVALGSLFLAMCLLIPLNTVYGFNLLYWFSDQDKALERDLLAGTPASVLAERYRGLLMHWAEPSEIAGYMRMLRNAGIGPFARMREDSVKPEDQLITQKIRYYMPEAGKVYLAWGLNGWHVAPEELRPAGTKVENNIMYTPMMQEGDTFVANIQAPAGTTIDYCFRIAKKRGSFDITWPICDGNYQVILSKDSITEVKTKVTLAVVIQEIRYQMPEAGKVYLVWGLNGWYVAPEELRPAGTKVKSNLMHTAMIRDGDTFVAKIWVPAGTPIDYGFRITERRGLFDIVYPIWDGGYRDTPSENSIKEVKGAVTLNNDFAILILDNKLYFLAGVSTLVITWLVLFFSLDLLKTELVKVSDKAKLLGQNKPALVSIMGLACIAGGLLIHFSSSPVNSQGNDKTSSMKNAGSLATEQRLLNSQGNDKTSSMKNAGSLATEQRLLVTQEFRYHLPEAGEVFLVWGINGWQLAPESLRPPRTKVESGVMLTSMVLEGDTFVAKVQVPADTLLDYGFQTRKTRSGVAIDGVWDGDYQTVPSVDGLIERKATVTLPQAQLARP